MAAAVVDSVGDGAYEGAYTALAPADAARLTLLPLVRNRHTTSGFTTSIIVHNPSTVATDVSLRVADNNGTMLPLCQGCRVTLPPGGAHLFAPSPALPFIPVGTFGSARVESDQPVVALVTESSAFGSADTSNYAGIGVPDAPILGALLAPYVVKGNGVSWRPPVSKRYFPWGDATRP